MKNVSLSRQFHILLVIALLFAVPSSYAEPLAVFPKPKSMTYTKSLIEFTKNTPVYVNQATLGDQQTRDVIELLWYGWFARSPNIKVLKGSTLGPNVKLVFIKDANLPNKLGAPLAVSAEAYRIKSKGKNIQVIAANANGFFNAIQTLLQLNSQLELNSSQRIGKLLVPSVMVEDFPHQQWRGFMLDSSRHFRSVEFILKTIDVLALHKFNRLHLHFSDDDAYRLESKIFPKLTSLATRGSTTFWSAHHDDKARTEELLKQPSKWPEPKYYTHKDIKKIVDYAKRRFIQVIPELDIPGHFAAVLRAYPEHRLVYQDIETKKTEVGLNTMNVFSKDALIFVKRLLTEIHDVFGRPVYFHIGADEVNLRGYRLAPKTQTDFLRNIEVFVRETLKSEPIIWNAHLKPHVDGGLKSGIVQHWHYDTEQSNAKEYFANSTLKHINSLSYYYYLDMVQAPNQKGMNWGTLDGIKWNIKNYPSPGDIKDLNLNSESDKAILSARTIYEMNNHFEVLVKIGIPLKKLEETTIGVEAALWGEYLKTDQDAWEKMLPRLASISEQAWRTPRYLDPKFWSAPWEVYFEQLQSSIYPRYRVMGISDYFQAPKKTTQQQKSTKKS